MPLYRLKCQICREESEIFRTIATRDDVPSCECGGKRERILSPTFIQASFQEYISPATGKLISSRDQFKEDLKASGCFIQEAGVARDIERNRVSRMNEGFAPLDKTIDEAVCSLVSQGKLVS